MSFKTEFLVAIIIGAMVSSGASVSAQVGEVLDDTDRGAVEATDETGAERLSPSDPGDASDDAEAAEEPDEPWSGEDEGRPTPYRVGAENQIELGGYVLASFFTMPSLPDLQTGLGFQGRIATRVWGDFIGEGNVGIMFNPDRGGGSTYKTAMLRIGGRYPIDLHADPVLFFVGAGAALDMFWTSTVTTVGRELSTSAIVPAFDLQFGLMYALGDRFAIELIAQGTYAFSNVVFRNNDTSWFSLLAGVSYDI